jgi:hypothetical protein
MQLKSKALAKAEGIHPFILDCLPVQRLGRLKETA